jgi:hypothetical protein
MKGEVFELCSLVIVSSIILDSIKGKKISKKRLQKAKKQLLTLDLCDKQYRAWLEEKERKVGLV